MRVFYEFELPEISCSACQLSYPDRYYSEEKVLNCAATGSLGVPQDGSIAERCPLRVKLSGNIKVTAVKFVEPTIRGLINMIEDDKEGDELITATLRE